MSDDTVVEYSAEWWATEVQSAEKELDSKFRDSGDRIVNRYLDIRDDGDAIRAVEQSGARKYNVFWANTEILKSALYATPPRPIVKRTHDDPNDDTARVGALIFQRILLHRIDNDNSDMHSAFMKAVEDRLVPGLGQVWCRLKTDVEKGVVDGVEVKQIKRQELCTDYVHWRDFIWGPARVWSEVPWVARRVWMSKKNFIARFGEEKYRTVKESINTTGRAEHGYPKGFEKGRVRVLEIWCKETMKAYWIQPDAKIELDALDDPLKLRDFFPCPEPLLATHTTNSLVPRADFTMVQDQYDELDLLNNRISILTKALRVVGAYDQNNTALTQMITGAEFNMIPVDNWAMLAEKGGMKGVVDWFPVEQVAKVLEGLVALRPLVIQQIYELTSISDIMRGGSNPRETLGAQKLKAQYSSVRLRLTQQAVALFVCRVMKIHCEILSKHVTPEEIRRMSAIDYTESRELAPAAIDFIKQLDANDYRITITEESLSMADYTAEREMRIAYITAVGQFLSQSSQMVTSIPAALPYIVKMITWVTSSFRGSDDIETVLDQAAASAMQNPPQLAGQEQQKPDNTLEVANIKAKVDTENNIRDNKTRLIIAEAERNQKGIIERERMAQDSQTREAERTMRAQESAANREATAKPPVTVDMGKMMETALQPLVESAQVQAQAAQVQLQSSQVLAASIQELAQAVAKPRRRVPVRDDAGEILYSDEVPIPEGEDDA